MIRSKKSLHINMAFETHAGFRVQCVKRGLSMQEVIEAFAIRVSHESNDVMRMMDQLVRDKQIKAVKKYTKNDVDSIFNMLEAEDPLKIDGDDNGS